MKYYKRNHSQVIQRFNKDWSAVDWYYFEVNDDNYAEKQIQVTSEGKVFKYDMDYLEDENGGLAEGALLVEEYTEIEAIKFFELWDKSYANTFLIKQLVFNDQWVFSWNNLLYNQTEQELLTQNLILCGTYHDIFMVNVEFGENVEFLFFEIYEKSANIHFSKESNWEDLVHNLQGWINYIENHADLVFQKNESEKLERILKVEQNGIQKEAIFTTYRNYDHGIERFRGAYLLIENQQFALKESCISMEDLLIKLQEFLPSDIKILSCFFCRFSNYFVAGNDNFGDLNCYKYCKAKCEKVKSKDDIIDLHNEEYANSQKVEETHWCIEFESIKKSDYVFKNQVK